MQLPSHCVALAEEEGCRTWSPETTFNPDSFVTLSILCHYLVCREADVIMSALPVSHSPGEEQTQKGLSASRAQTRGGVWLPFKEPPTWGPVLVSRTATRDREGKSWQILPVIFLVPLFSWMGHCPFPVPLNPAGSTYCPESG